jgi:glucose 1-dehydrogenase
VLLEGRKAVVAGAASGIGAATAARLGAEGADVCVAYYTDDEEPRAAAIVEEIRRAGAARGADAFACTADVGDEDQVAALVSGAVERFGRVDVFVNSAGIQSQSNIVDMPLDAWERVIRTNLTGTFLCVREAARAMVASRGGVIVIVSSVHQRMPWPGFAHYSASKAGMQLLMESAARELAPHGIRLANVAPGAIATPINRERVAEPDFARRVEAEIPLGRLGEAEDVAAAAAWAASDEARYVTGATIVVDGGMLLYPNTV